MMANGQPNLAHFESLIMCVSFVVLTVLEVMMNRNKMKGNKMSASADMSYKYVSSDVST